MSEEGVPTKIIEDSAAADIKKVLEALPSPVRLVLFTAAGDHASDVQRKILHEMQALSSNIILEEHELMIAPDEAARYGVEMAPCTIVRG